MGFRQGDTSGVRHLFCPLKACGDCDFAMSSRLLKILDFTLFYPHVTFKISPEGNRRKEIKNEISVKVFLDVETVNILDEYDLEDDF